MIKTVRQAPCRESNGCRLIGHDARPLFYLFTKLSCLMEEKKYGNLNIFDNTQTLFIQWRQRKQSDLINGCGRPVFSRPDPWPPGRSAAGMSMSTAIVSNRPGRFRSVTGCVSVGERRNLMWWCWDFVQGEDRRWRPGPSTGKRRKACSAAHRRQKKDGPGNLPAHLPLAGRTSGSEGRYENSY